MRPKRGRILMPTSATGSLHLLKIPLPFEESPPNTLRKLILFFGKESSVGRFSHFKRSTQREKEINSMVRKKGILVFEMPHEHLHSVHVPNTLENISEDFTRKEKRWMVIDEEGR
jgi:hypothetical protein